MNQTDTTNTPSSERGWWIVAKIALFIAIPALVIYLVKLVAG
jgi:hypothetical protein